ncbi:MAG: FAD:protein FMN transferase [Thermoguttaceae bacterium]|nr:FAD:protein FMN transferase [Thermoguttaceae bacterium]
MTDNPYATPGALTVFRRAAMASDFEAAFNESADEDVADAALDALDEVDRVEEALSVFRPTSAVSRLNLLGAEMSVRVDDELWNWIETSIRLGEETDGAFDVASAPLWRVWGFANRDGEFPKEEDRLRALALSGRRHLRLNPESRSVAFDEPGVELNFGAIGKGIALDLAAAKLEERGVFDFLVQGGKSGVVARGGRVGDYSPAALEVPEGDEEEDAGIDEESGLPRRGASTKARETLDAILPEAFRLDAALLAQEKLRDAPTGWTIGVAHPLVPEKRIGELWLRDRALATSGSTWQFFRAGGKRYSHIVDPRTGFPTTGVLSTTVLAPTATEADALSTAFFVLGPEKTEDFCRRRPEVAALMILEREVDPGYELATFNLDAEVFHAL